MANSMVTQQATNSKPQPVIITTPWSWGFQDASEGKSVYFGNHYFAGPKLGEYRKGWAEGQRVKAQRSH